MKTKLLKSIRATALTLCASHQKSNRFAARSLAVLALLPAVLCAPLASRANAQELDAVLTWNSIMQTTVGAGNANVQGRSAAIVQLAVFEAVNAIVG